MYISIVKKPIYKHTFEILNKIYYFDCIPCTFVISGYITYIHTHYTYTDRVSIAEQLTIIQKIKNTIICFLIFLQDS